MSARNEPAYPGQPLNPSGTPQCEYQIGLTKRELFAAMAMQALLGRSSARPGSPTAEAMRSFAETGARVAIRHADALLAELEKTP